MSMTRRAAEGVPRPEFLVLVVLGSLLLAGFLAGCSSGDDPTPVTPTGPTTAAEYTARGWERFEDADYSGALSDFNQAIDRNATYGEAYTGQGWTLMAQAVSPTAMQSVVGSFDNAINNGVTGADALAGRAAANLGAGGESLDNAEADALAALAADGSFIFSHGAGINTDDLRLINAFAQAVRGEFSGALAAADQVLDSGIEEGSSVTWAVDGTTYDSFTGAVLAHLHKISGQFSG